MDGLNEALLAKAAEAKLLRTSRLRADTTVVPANVAYPTDSGLLAKAIRRIAVTGRRIQAAGGARRARLRDRGRAAGRRALARAQAKAARLAAAGVRDAAAGRRRGRLRRAVDDLAELLDATAKIAAQARQRIAGTTPPGSTRRVSLHEPDARPIAKGQLG